MPPAIAFLELVIDRHLPHEYLTNGPHRITQKEQRISMTNRGAEAEYMIPLSVVVRPSVEVEREVVEVYASDLDIPQGIRVQIVLVLAHPVEHQLTKVLCFLKI